MKNMLVIDGKEIQLSDETVKEIKEKLGINKEVDWLKEDIEYYYINYYGNIVSAPFSYDRIDKHNKLTGNYYKTKEIAEKKLADMQDDIARKFVKVENYVRNNDDGFAADWNNSNSNCYVYFENDKNEWLVSNAFRCQSNNFYMSEPMAEKVVEILNRGDFDEKTD